MLPRHLIQIAGVIDQAEADMLQDSNVHYLGFPLRLPVHQEDLSETDAATIIGGLRPTTRAVLITYLNDAKTILDLCHFLGVRVVQLHGRVEVDQLESVKKLDPGLTVLKSFVVGDPLQKSLDATIAEMSPHVDAFITDTFDPATGASGATGKVHDWRISRRIVETSKRPVILAGGLTPHNVKQAIVEVGPAGVDCHTGVEDVRGRKDSEKVGRFVAEAMEGFAIQR